MIRLSLAALGPDGRASWTVIEGLLYPLTRINVSRRVAAIVSLAFERQEKVNEL